MNSILSKAAWLVLSLMPATALASHWSYQGESGPEHWGTLNDAYQLCQTGMNQSPINITSPLNAHLSPLSVRYSDGPLTLLNNGHTIQAELPATSANTITLDGMTYRLSQFHFHAPAENTVDGKRYPLEMHLVHQDDRGHIAVVAVMFATGKASAALNALWNVMPAQEEQRADIRQLNLNALLPKNRAYMRFSGSLTTPPCSEGVVWIVLKQPLTLSSAQLAKFTQVMRHDNNRPVQPLHGRVVVE